MIIFTTASCPLNIELGGEGCRQKLKLSFLEGCSRKTTSGPFFATTLHAISYQPPGRRDEYLPCVLGSISHRPAQHWLSTVFLDPRVQAAMKFKEHVAKTTKETLETVWKLCRTHEKTLETVVIVKKIQNYCTPLIALTVSNVFLCVLHSFQTVSNISLVVFATCSLNLAAACARRSRNTADSQCCAGRRAMLPSTPCNLHGGHGLRKPTWPNDTQELTAVRWSLQPQNGTETGQTFMSMTGTGAKMFI